MKILIKNLLLVCISIFILLFVFEIFLRFIPFVGTASYTQPVDKTSPIPHFKPNNKFVYAQGWNGKIVIEHTTNSYGFATPINGKQPNPYADAGTPRYLPPEYLTSRYDPIKHDAFSLGLTIICEEYRA